MTKIRRKKDKNADDRTQFEVKPLRKGDPEPPVVTGEFWVTAYFSPMCINSQRTEISLYSHGIRFTRVWIDTNDPPEWFLEKSPLGITPAIQIEDGMFVWDWNICNEFLEQKWWDRPFMAKKTDPRDRNRMMIKRLQPLEDAYYALYKEKTPEKIKVLKDAYDLAESLMKEFFFTGILTGYSDYMIWPIIERAAALPLYWDDHSIPTITPETYPELSHWIPRMLHMRSMRKTTMTAEIHAEYMKSVRDGKPKLNLIEEHLYKTSLRDDIQP